jgi:hypothetical protein
MKKFFYYCVAFLILGLLTFVACKKEESIAKDSAPTENSEQELEAKISNLSLNLESSRQGKAFTREGGITASSVTDAIIDIEAALNYNFGNATQASKDIRNASKNITVSATNGTFTEANMQYIYNTAYNLWYNTYSNYAVSSKHPIVLDIAKIDSLSSGNEINVYIGAFVGESELGTNTNTPCLTAFNESHYWREKFQNIAGANCNPTFPAADNAINIYLAKKTSPYNPCIYYTDIVTIGNNIVSTGGKMGIYSNTSYLSTYNQDTCIPFELMNSHCCAIVDDFNNMLPAGNSSIVRSIIGETALLNNGQISYTFDFHALKYFVYGKKKIKSVCNPKVVPPPGF